MSRWRVRGGRGGVVEIWMDGWMDGWTGGKEGGTHSAHAARSDTQHDPIVEVVPSPMYTYYYYYYYYLGKTLGSETILSEDERVYNEYGNGTDG